MIDGVIANMIVAVELIQKVIDPMSERKFGRIVNITSGSVKMPLAGLDLSSGARAGFTAFLAGVARTVADKNVTINNHPARRIRYRSAPRCADEDGQSKRQKRKSKSPQRIATSPPGASAIRTNSVRPARFSARRIAATYRSELADRRRHVQRSVLKTKGRRHRRPFESAAACALI